MAIVVSLVFAPAAKADPPVSMARFAGLAAAPLKVAPGGQVTFSGRLEGRAASGWVPLTARKVTLYADDYADSPGGQAVGEATTNGDGAFQASLTVTETVYVQARFAETGSDVDAEGGYPRVVVAGGGAKTAFPSFKAAIDAKGVVSLEGVFAPNSGLDYPAFGFDVQYSPSGKGGWKSVRRVTAYAGDEAPFHAPFSARFKDGRAGFWRVLYAGNDDLNPAVSTVRKAWRWRSGFSKIKVTPRKTEAGRKVTVSGVLGRYGAGRTKAYGYARQKVVIAIRCKGMSSWYSAGAGRTDTRGRFKIPVPASCDAVFAAVFLGGGDTFASQSPNRVSVDTTP